ncbi:vacuolar protein sorting 28 (yeast) (predicted), isoform CRA_d [Rattus norvegicus]|uniref:Vacuolar protein sorting 28 (Yeast) (Predicted), isoform CRA_d n=1 Tax=Rattus norvegicus TaxID=10116 RepID=A6HSB5_RAT|nr:vacuolar protein sorting 28 (yeast) (predicted), isoform CRA_d [Rattus norvegicus]
MTPKFARCSSIWSQLTMPSTASYTPECHRGKKETDGDVTPQLPVSTPVPHVYIVRTLPTIKISLTFLL